MCCRDPSFRCDTSRQLLGRRKRFTDDENLPRLVFASGGWVLSINVEVQLPGPFDVFVLRADICFNAFK
jgi:hypothetical protein